MQPAQLGELDRTEVVGLDGGRAREPRRRVGDAQREVAVIGRRQRADAIVSFPSCHSTSVYRVDRPTRQSSRPPSATVVTRLGGTMRTSASPTASRNARQLGGAGAITRS